MPIIIHPCPDVKDRKPEFKVVKTRGKNKTDSITFEDYLNDEINKFK